MAGASNLAFPDDNEEWPHLSSYTRLDPLRKEIRLFGFEDSHDGELRLQMRNASLVGRASGSDNLHSVDDELQMINDKGVRLVKHDTHLKYSALSYCWGKAEEMVRIFVDKEPVLLRRHLVEFLCNIRDMPYGSTNTIVIFGYFWLDVLCINQTDLEERNYQVSIMSEIFSNAESVIAWLGVPTPANKTFYEFVRQRHHAICAQDHNKDSRTNIFAVPEDIPLAVPVWVSGMEDWTLRLFWTRLWIVQECALAETLFLMSGAMMIKFETLVDAQRVAPKSINRLSLHSGCRERVLIIDWLRKNIHENGVRHESLLTLMQWFETSECRDPRDAVYALLSLSLEKADVRVDYARTALSLWWEIFRICQSQATASLGVYSQQRDLRLMARLLTKMKPHDPLFSPLVDLIHLDYMALLEVYSLSEVYKAREIYQEGTQNFWPYTQFSPQKPDNKRKEKFYVYVLEFKTDVTFPWHEAEKRSGVTQKSDQYFCSSCPIKLLDLLVSFGSSSRHRVVLRETNIGTAGIIYSVVGCAWQLDTKQVGNNTAKIFASRWFSGIPTGNNVRARFSSPFTRTQYRDLAQLCLRGKWHELGLKPLFLETTATGVYGLMCEADGQSFLNM